MYKIKNLFMLSLLMVSVLATSSFSYVRPECKKSDIKTDLTWTNTASCAIHRMAHNYKDVGGDIQNRLTGSVDMGSVDIDDDAKKKITDEAKKIDTSKEKGPILQYVRLEGSAVKGFYNLQPYFMKRLLKIAVALKQATGKKMVVTSAYRSPAHQARLFRDAVKKYGSQAKARKHVAPPGRSRHNSGLAADIDLLGKKQGNMINSLGLLRQYSCWRPMSWENWHIEPEETRASRGAGKSPNIMDNRMTDDVGVSNNMYGETQSEMTDQYSVMESESRYTDELILMTTESIMARNFLRAKKASAIDAESISKRKTEIQSAAENDEEVEK